MEAMRTIEKKQAMARGGRHVIGPEWNWKKPKSTQDSSIYPTHIKHPDMTT